MPIRPEEITLSGLPRSPFPGGIKADAAAELLRRTAEDYRALLAQTGRLALTVEEQARRMEELEQQIAALEADAATRKRPDELAHKLLASARQAAREERESVRRECELLLKKAERRAESIEREAHRRHASKVAALEQLDVFRDELSARLRSTLEAIAALRDDESLYH